MQPGSGPGAAFAEEREEMIVRAIGDSNGIRLYVEGDEAPLFDRGAGASFARPVLAALGIEEKEFEEQGGSGLAKGLGTSTGYRQSSVFEVSAAQLTALRALDALAKHLDLGPFTYDSVREALVCAAIVLANDPFYGRKH